MSISEKYHKANELLERRIKQLSKKGKITLHPDIKDLIYNRNKALDPVEPQIVYLMVISYVHGIEETVNSSDDRLVKGLYEKCNRLREASDAEAKRVIGQHCVEIRREEIAEYGKIAHIRFS